METPDSESLSGNLATLLPPQLVHALARRQEEEWLPEAYSEMEVILRRRGVAAQEAVAAVRNALPDPNTRAELVTVASVFGPVEAQLIRMRLEQVGVDVHLVDENLVSIHYPLGIAVGGVKVLVSGG
jgi:hypothetical protein